MTAANRAASPDDRQNVAVGIGLMLLAILVFSANDALGKWMAGTYSAGQILLFRSTAAMIVLAPIVYRMGLNAFLSVERPGLQVVRVVCSAGETACFYIAVAAMPLADIMTVYLASPIFVTVLAALILKERVGWRRWSAVLAGFGGVVLALQPAATAVGWPVLVALLGSVLFAFLMIATRSLRATPDVVMVGWQMAGTLIFGIVVAPFVWVPIPATDVALLAVVGIVAMLAIGLVNRSLKLAPASVVVPYQYTLIVWAAVFGYVFFGDVPDGLVVAGALVIIGAGLFIFLREQRVTAKPPPRRIVDER